jgi:hypothetical protein
MHQKDYIDFMINFEKNVNLSQALKQKFFGKYKAYP